MWHLTVLQCSDNVWGAVAGQTQPQSFQQHSGQTPADQRQAAAVQSSAITIHPDITLDQDTKILTVGQGQASFFGQKYTLPALPFKLPATPALNSLQSLYPSEPPAPLAPLLIACCSPRDSPFLATLCGCEAFSVNCCQSDTHVALCRHEPGRRC